MICKLWPGATKQAEVAKRTDTDVLSIASFKRPQGYEPFTTFLSKQETKAANSVLMHARSLNNGIDSIDILGIEYPSIIDQRTMIAFQKQSCGIIRSSYRTHHIQFTELIKPPLFFGKERALVTQYNISNQYTNRVRYSVITSCKRWILRIDVEVNNSPLTKIKTIAQLEPYGTSVLRVLSSSWIWRD